MFNDNIFDIYNPHELRTIFKKKEWPQEFSNYVNTEIAFELLESWLENVDDETYREKVRLIIENETYGYEDENGKEMLQFDP
jgi:hypothetical protein